MNIYEQIAVADSVLSKIAAPDGGDGNLLLRFIGSPRHFVVSIEAKSGTMQGAGTTLEEALNGLHQSIGRSLGKDVG